MREMIKKLNLDLSMHENRESGSRIAKAVKSVGSVNVGAGIMKPTNLLKRHKKEKYEKEYGIDLDLE
jgi:hypothetical protein